MSNFFLQYPDNGVQKYSSFAVFPAIAADGALALAKDTDILYAYSVGSSSWVEIGGPGSVLAVGTIDSTTASSNGAAIVADALIMQSASTTKPGLVNNTTQSMSGAKTFTTSVETPSLLLKGSVSGDLTHTVPSAVTPYSLSWPASQAGGATFLKNDGSGGLSWASGTGASGVDSVGTINAQTKSADGAVISGTTIYFQTADATNPGMVSTGSQTFAGTKTFANVIDSGLTISTALVADGSKQLASSSTTSTELGYVHGVTSAIQTQLDSKQSTTLTNTHVLVGNVSNVATDVAVSGDATMANTGALTLATVNSNVGSFGDATHVSGITVNGKGLVTAAASTLIQIAESQVTNLTTDLAAKQSTTLTSAHVLVGNVSNVASDVAMSGDIAISNAGATSIVGTTNATLTTLSGLTTASSLVTVGTIGTGTWAGTKIAETHGGTNQTAYTKGDILYSSAANTLSKLGIGSSGNVLVVSAGVPAWAASPAAAPSYNYTSQTTGYSAVINDWVVCSGASFTVTLPTAASVAGQTIVIQHAGTSLTQVYTLATTSAQTIGGIASGSYALFTSGETITVLSDGSNWQILNHKTDTAWISFSMGLSGTSGATPVFATGVATNAAYWKRRGQNVVVQFTYDSTGGTGGTNGSSTTYLWALPSNMTFDSTFITYSTDLTIFGKGTSLGVGVASTNATNRNLNITAYDSTHVMASLGASGGTWGSTNIAISTSANAHGSFIYEAPIVNWQP